MFTEEYRTESAKLHEENSRQRLNVIEWFLGFSLILESCNIKTKELELNGTKEFEYIKNNEEIHKNFFETKTTLYMESYKVTHEYEELNKDYLIAVINYHESLK